MAEKIHLTRPEYRGRAACEPWRTASWACPTSRIITEDVSDVTCRSCLKRIASEQPLDELREAARKVLNQ